MIKKNNSGRKSVFSTRQITMLLFVAIAGFFLWTEHQAHLLGVLPFLILLLCPFMHFFMHRDHGGHASQDNQQQGHDSAEGGKS